MRKFVAIFVLMALILILYQHTDELMVNQNKNSKLQTLLDYEIERYYPSTPREVVELFSQTLTYIYNLEVTDEEVALLLQQQRKLFDTELLENNPYDVHLERVLLERENYGVTDKKIIDYKTREMTPDDYSQDNQVSEVSVVYYLVEQENPNINIYQKYILQKDVNNLWKIKGWVETEEFTIVGD